MKKNKLGKTIRILFLSLACAFVAAGTVSTFYACDDDDNKNNNNKNVSQEEDDDGWTDNY